MDQLRIGTLSTARITPPALIDPARFVPRVAVTAVAARNRADAEAFAAEQGIAVVHDSYEALLADPDIDAVYNPLPNSLHGPWTLRAIEAGKHVLCEKPFTSNAAEAVAVADAARAAGVMVMEAMHYRYHPLTSLLREQVGKIAGPQEAVRHIKCDISFPLAGLDDIRYVYALGGGATMDAGCYGIDLVRLLGPGEPEVVSALATEQVPGVDRSMTAYLRFPSGTTAWLDLSFSIGGKFRADVHVVGDRGQVQLQNFMHPYVQHRLVTGQDGQFSVISEQEPPPGAGPEPGAGQGTPAGSTYHHQLLAFAAAVVDGEPFPNTPQHATVTMQLIDDIYRAAGLPPRGGDPA
ncbi:MAG: Gfo/Idh/MocA family oxidoreductase [Actinomycetota bacterium]